MTCFTESGSAEPVGTNRQLPRVAVVTGASSGIGLYTALGLARAGMRVVMAGRDRRRTEAASRFVTESSGSEQIETALADFSRDLFDVMLITAADEHTRTFAAINRSDRSANSTGCAGDQRYLSAQLSFVPGCHQ